MGYYKNRMEKDPFKKPEIGDQVRARHRLNGEEMPKRSEVPGELSHLVFVDYCEGGVVTIVAFENGRTVIGCDRCTFRQKI